MSPGEGNIMVQASQSAPDVDLPNRVVVTPERGAELATEGEGLRTIANATTGPASLSGRNGEAFEEVVQTKAFLQAHVDQYGRRLAIRAFQGGGDRLSMTTVINPLLEPDDVVTVDKPRLGILRTLYRVAGWRLQMQPEMNESTATMSVDLVRQLEPSLSILDAGVGEEEIRAGISFRWGASTWDGTDPWA